MSLELRSLRVRYPNGALGILDVSLVVEQGAIVALFGPNGAGKSTTTRAIGGFLQSEGAKIVEGDVLLGGRRITGLEPHRIAALGVAVVPERNKVFANLSVAENLAALGNRMRRSDRRVLHERVVELFPILHKRRNQAAGRLSGGERQMLAIGRALLLDPRLLVIDEMTLGLHHSLQPSLYAAVERIAQEGTSVLVVDESNAFALEIADHCYRIEDGTITAQGPASSFRSEGFAASHGVTP